MKTFLFLLAFLPGHDAFCVNTPFGSPLNAMATSQESNVAAALNMVKKKRRRRKTPEESAAASGKAVPGGTSDALPDFDLDDEPSASVVDAGSTSAPAVDTVAAAATATTTPVSPPVLPEFVLSDDVEIPKRKLDREGNEVTEAMLGTTNKSVRSINDLIQDRSLENTFIFDGKEADSAIPDFTDLAKTSSLSPDSIREFQSLDGFMGKKKARQVERKAAAMEAQKEETSFLEQIPFFKDSKGEVNPIKILESGAWGGIYLLVAWELYINSPFFDRAAPMAPVVYNFLM